MARRGSSTSAINANMTPMIDVTFLLIVFFVVVSQIVDRDAVSMDLPAPVRSASGIPEEPLHVTVNLVPLEGGEIAGIIVGGHVIAADAMDELTAMCVLVCRAAQQMFSCEQIRLRNIRTYMG